MSNVSSNSESISNLLKEIKKLSPNFDGVRKKTLNSAVNSGIRFAKKGSPVISGYFRNNWKSTPILKNGKNMQKGIANNTEYASFVNYGHRIVDKAGNTIGYVHSKKGDHLLERTVDVVKSKMNTILKNEIENLKRGSNG